MPRPRLQKDNDKGKGKGKGKGKDEVNSSPSLCQSCLKKCTPDSSLQCSKCLHFIHIKCTKISQQAAAFLLSQKELSYKCGSCIEFATLPEEEEKSKKYEIIDEEIMLTEIDDNKATTLILADHRHEKTLMQHIESLSTPHPPLLQRLYRKLAVRQLKRRNGLPIFDLDKFMIDYVSSSSAALIHENESNKRKHQKLVIPYFLNPKLSLYSKLTGDVSYPSAKAGKILFRDYTSLPPKLAILRAFSKETITPIDYIHFNESHLHQVNSLLSHFFWPGIDVSEALEWPSLSFIAAYKHLIIGCVFCAPSGYVTYLFVHPDWQNSAIASTLLFLLIEALPRNVDLLLHVSATNTSAMLLYQKFGFKPERYTIGFYDKYYGDHQSRLSKNAFLMRLRRPKI